MTEPIPLIWGDKRYYTLNYHLREIFGEKVFKLPLDAGCTCPNRDGSKGWGGCAFCGLRGAGEHIPGAGLSLTRQMEQGVRQVQKKWQPGRYIAYFQAYTNTYAPLGRLEQMYEEALAFPGIVGLAIATRPDCLEPPVLELLTHFNRRTHLWIELGVQSSKDSTLTRLHTGYTFDETEKALQALNVYGIRACPHVILGLPGESKTDALETVKALIGYSLYGIKLQMFHVLKDSELGQLYQAEPFPLLSQDEYIDWLVSALELLPPSVVIHRVTGDGPRDTLLAPNWTRDKLRVLSQINQVLSKQGTWQGRLWHKQTLGQNA